VSERLPSPLGPRVRDTTIHEPDLVVLTLGERLVRIHSLAGPYPSAWDEFRAYGPTSSRFDHHPSPVRRHPRRRIAYLTRSATAFTAAVAEYYQDGGASVGPIDTGNRRPAVSVIDITRPLRLLDLDGGWITRAGGNQAIRTGPRGRARQWARAIYQHHGGPNGLDGLAYSSSVWGPGRCVTLWDRAEDAFPPTPTAHRTLDDPVLATPVASAAESLGSYVI